MGYSYRHIIHLFILLLLASYAEGQSLIKHYENLHETSEGCQIYNGLLDDVFELEMLICEDKGAYKMKSSADVYNISLEEEDGIVEITEEDDQGRTSGYITLVKNDNGYQGTWRQIESAASYSFVLQNGEAVQREPEKYITKLSGVIRSRLVHISLDHANESVEIQERYGLQGRYKSLYTCQDENCNKVSIKPEGIVGVSSVEIYQDKKGEYKMIVLTSDQNREVTDLEVITQVQKKTKAYSDYRSMLLAEYATFDDKDLDKYLDRLQANWIKATSIKLRALHKEDPIAIVSDRLKHQASSWIDIEVWTDDFISGVQYKQYNWTSEVEAKAFAYYTDKSKAVQLNDVWEDDWDLSKLETNNEEENSTWVVGRDAIHKIYFDRINGVQRESHSYKDLSQYIDNGSWLDKLLSRGKIKY